MTRAATFAALLFVAGCAENETAILLSICSTVGPPDADTLLVGVAASGGAEDRSYSLADLDLDRRPLELSLRPGPSIGGALEIRASLLLGDDPVVTRRVATAFVKGEDIDVRILLDDSCIGIFCDADLTCDKGMCDAIGPGNDPCESGGGGDGGGEGECDEDGDQYLSPACGGEDCDDEVFAIHPDGAEICDQIDNDCSGEADDGLWIVSSERYASFAITDEQAPTIAWSDPIALVYGTAWRATRHCTTDDDCGPGQTCIANDCGIEELRFVRQDPEGTTPETTEQTVLSTGTQPFAGEPMLAWSGSEWGMVYEDIADGALGIYFRRIDRGGLGLDLPILISASDNGAYGPALAWTGDSWGAVWSEIQGGVAEVQFARMDWDGFVAAGATLTSGSDTFSAALDWGDNRFGVAWIDGSGAGSVLFLVVSDDGVPAIEPLLVSDGESTVGGTVDLVWAGDGYALVWDQIQDGVAQIFLARVDPNGESEGPPEQILRTGHRSVTPDLVYTGRELAVVTADGNEGDAQILLQRLTLDGEPIGGPVRMIGDDTARGSRPAIAWNEDWFEYGVVWQDQRLATDTDVWFNRYVCNDGT